MSENRQTFTCQITGFHTEFFDEHLQEYADLIVLSPLHYVGLISRCKATEELFNAPIGSMFTCSGILKEKYLGFHYSLDQERYITEVLHKITYPQKVRLIS